MRPARVIRSAIVLKPSTIMDFHRMLRNRKYRLLFSPKRRGRTGPKGPSTELVAAIVEMKRRNPVWGCPRIAEQIGLIFDIQIDKDVVRRVLATHSFSRGERSSGAPCEPQQCPLGFSLPGPGSAPSGGLTGNSRPTGEIEVYLEAASEVREPESMVAML